ncbi:hypothetical protein L218DRAFT_43256 [Marasmius fiardii PR-910]|nr:hypothetical protein L218DRAFT_43256 [Marasmius fiardii PR-910]
MEHLEIQNFNPVKVQAHPRVLAWEAEWMSRSPAATISAAALPSPQIIKDEEMYDELESATGYTNQTRSQQVTSNVDDDMLWEEMDSEDAINLYYDR